MKQPLINKLSKYQGLYNIMMNKLNSLFKDSSNKVVEDYRKGKWNSTNIDNYLENEIHPYSLPLIKCSCECGDTIMHYKILDKHVKKDKELGCEKCKTKLKEVK